MKIIDYIESNKEKDINIFCDMDGVISEYDIDNFDYSTIRPLKTNIEFLKKLYSYHNVNFYILSICKKNSTINDKIVWLNKYMPFVNKNNIILISKEKCAGESKELKYNYIKKHLNDVNIVIDDDIRIIRYIKNNLKSAKVFHVSSIIR